MKQPRSQWFNGDGNSCLSVRLLCRGTSAAALNRLGENVLCLRLLGHDRLEATNFGLGAAGNDTRIGPRNARFGPKQATGVGAADLIGSRTSRGLGKPLGGPRGPGGS